MRYLSKALVHGLSWLQQAKQDDRSHDKRVLSALTHVAKSAVPDRRLEGMFDYMDGGGADPFGDMIDEETLEQFEQCGVDLEAIVGDLMTSIMMGGGMMGGGDMMGEGGGLGDPEGGDDDALAAMMGGFNIGDLLSALAEEGETECDDSQTADFEAAVETFNACSGFDELELGISDDLVNSISEKCDEASDAATSAAMGNMDVDMDAMSDCLDEVLGQNVIGDLLRNIYHHPDKICKCMADFGEALPTCLVKVSVPEDAVPEEMEEFMPEGLDDMLFPLSLLKKATCLVGLGCSAIDSMCEMELAALDSCLPSADKASFSCLDAIEKCALEPEPPFSITAPPLLTMSELPDACQRVADDSVVEKYNHFNAVCNNGGAVTNNAEDNSPTEEEEDVSSSESGDDNEESSSEEEYEESSSEEYYDEESSEEDVEEAASEAVEAAAASAPDEKTDGDSDSANAWGPVVAVVGVAAVIAAILAIRSRRAAAVGVSSFPRSSGAYVATVSDDDIGDLAFEEGEMA